MNDKVVDYILVGAPSTSDLKEKVRRLLKEGWTPLGAPFRDLEETNSPFDNTITQAMIKYQR